MSLVSQLTTLTDRVADEFNTVRTELAAHVPGLWRTGDIKQTIENVADPGPPGWLYFNQSIANADTAHPDLWAMVPAGWKSGSTLNLPNLDGHVLREGATMGSLAGSDTISTVPLHSHPFTSGSPSNNTTAGPSNNTSGSPSANTTAGPSTNTSGGPSSASTGIQSASHSHSTGIPAGVSGHSSGTAHAHATGSNNTFVTLPQNTGTQSSNHSHSMQAHTHTLASHTHTMASHTHSLQSHTHTMQNHTHSGTTDNTGTATVDIIPRNMAVRTMIKT